MQSDQQLTFDRYTVALPHGPLLRGKRAIPLTSQTFAVLRYLVEHAAQVVTKAELFDSLWPGTAVSDGALTFCIVELRKALGDNAKQPKFIETVHRRGYRFLPAVTTTPLQGSGVGDQGSVRERRNEVARLPDHAVTGSALPSGPRTPSLVLVGREPDLAQLHTWLAKALNGERQIVFVTGEAGIGKTTLVETFVFGVRSRKEFGVRSHEKFGVQNLPSPTPNPKLPSTPRPWFAWGQCIEHYGPGEPYMPMLEALGRLCRAPDGEQLVTLLQQHAPTWLVQMPSLLNAAELETLQRQTQGATRERMLREMGEAIDAISAERPLVLVLEDLHWSDASTLELLALLARRRESARVLVIGTYRPVDIIVQEHPLRVVKQELQLHGLCAELPLGLLSETQVAEYLEQRLSVGATGRSPLPSLVKVIHRRTDGNPLFMVTAVEDLIAQKMLVQQDGQWRVQEELAAIEARIPDNLQHLITQHIERLHSEDRHLLEVASVVGLEFSAAAVAVGLEAAPEHVEEQCEALVRHARFLRVSGTEEWPDGTVAARYSFLHALHQEVLYNRIPAGRRQRLHLRIGEREEAAYGERAREIAAALAVHFEQGRDYRKAVQYLRRAGENALRRSAHQEAIGLLTKGLELLKPLPNNLRRSQQELALQISLSDALSSAKGFGALEVEAALTRARELCQQLEGSPQLVPVLSRLVVFSMIRGEIQTARELSEQLLRLAPSIQDRLLLSGAHGALAIALFFLGELSSAQPHLEQAITLYDPLTSPRIPIVTVDPRINYLAYAAWNLWHLGYPDQALQKSQEAGVLAAGLAHPFSLAFILGVTAIFHANRREEHRAREHADAAIALSIEHGFPHYAAVGKIIQGWALTEQGQAKEGIAQMQRGLTISRTVGSALGLTSVLAKLAEAYGKIEQVEEGLTVLAEAFTNAEKSRERFYEAELYRIKGELTLQQESQKSKGKNQKSKVTDSQSLTPDPHGEAEACFHKAIEVSRHQQAKSLELRTTMSLAGLWQSQGKDRESYKMLSEIYNWFTEGFDTKDLQEAKLLLRKLR